jgi:hypothetical protein
MTDKQCCGNCSRGYKRENNLISCGAGFEENPIWAKRKYSATGILYAMLAEGKLPPGSDCEAMKPDDGINCPAWEINNVR